MTRDFTAWCKQRQQRVDLHLEIDLENQVTEFSFATAPYLNDLYHACTYATLGGGKRMRPLLCYAAAEAIGKEPDIALDTVAASIELMHAYSLVHDDLPAMDDDDLRRGKPTCHKAFDEATAILVGDALQCRAFELLTVIDTYSAATRLDLVATLAAAAGPRGMVGGQAIDIAAVNTAVTIQYLESMHTLKTGALITAALKMGGTAAGADLNQLDALSRFGSAIGLAFQVQDDILDVNSDSDTSGKTQGADVARNKPTYVSLLGLDGATAKAEELYVDAVNALEGLGAPAWALRTLAEQVVTRRN